MPRRVVAGLSEKARRSFQDKSLSRVDQILGDCDRLGIRIMTIQDAIYPERLRAIHQPPLVLYWKGRDIARGQRGLQWPWWVPGAPPPTACV